MEERSKRLREHDGHVKYTQYKITISCIDRADSSDVTMSTLYLESSTITNVYKHILKEVAYPEWIYYIDEEEYEKLKYLDELSDQDIEEYFSKAYGEYQSPDDDYNDKYHFAVEEYEPPVFTRLREAVLEPQPLDPRPATPNNY